MQLETGGKYAIGGTGSPRALDKNNDSVRTAEHAVLCDQEVDCRPPENGKGGRTGKASSVSTRGRGNNSGVAPASVINPVELPLTSAAANSGSEVGPLGRLGRVIANTRPSNTARVRSTKGALSAPVKEWTKKETLSVAGRAADKPHVNSESPGRPL